MRNLSNQIYLYSIIFFFAIVITCTDSSGWSYDISGVGEYNQSNSGGLYSIYTSEDMYNRLSQLSYDIEKNDFIAADFDLLSLIENYADKPELPDEILNTAAGCAKANKHDYAVKIYSQLIFSWPRTIQASFALEQMAIEYSLLGDEEKAHLAIDKLKNNSGSFPQKAECFYRLGWHYSERKNVDDYGAELYEYAATNCSKSDYAMFAQVELIKYELRKGEFEKGGLLYKKLISEYSDSSALVSKIWTIADVYLQKDDPNSASNIYNDIQTVSRKGPQIVWARAGAAIINAYCGRDSDANEIIEEIYAKYSDNPDIGAAVFQIGALYRYLGQQEYQVSRTHSDKLIGYYKRACTIWERILREFPDSDIIPKVYYFAGQSYGVLGQSEKEIEYYQKVVDTWPDYNLAAHIQFMIARYYENLVRIGKMSEIEASPKLRKAYENLINNYPDFSASNRAAAWFDSH